MARRTKAQQGEIIREYYGINMKTFAVERVSLTRGGTLSLFRGDRYLTHNTAGREARGEIVIVFGIGDLMEATPLIDDPKKMYALLQAKADKMKAEHEAKDAAAQPDKAADRDA